MSLDTALTISNEVSYNNISDITIYSLGFNIMWNSNIVPGPTDYYFPFYTVILLHRDNKLYSDISGVFSDKEYWTEDTIIQGVN